MKIEIDITDKPFRKEYRIDKMSIKKTNSKNSIILGLATLTVILNGLIGHFFAPMGIMLTPIAMTITTLFVCIGTSNIKLYWISILTFLFIALNDILIKLYAGGSHDKEGSGFILSFLVIGLVPTLIILLIKIFGYKDEKKALKTKVFILFIVLLVIHLILTVNLGLGRCYWYDWNG